MAIKSIIEVWGIPTCTSTRKAVKLLEAEGVEFQYKNLKEIKAPKTLVREMLKTVDTPRRVWNTSGAAYREGNWKNKIQDMKREEIVLALVDEPMLIKRPVVRTPKGTLVGFDEDALRELL